MIFATIVLDRSNCCKTYTSSISFAIKDPESDRKSEPEPKPKPKPEPEPKPLSEDEPKSESETKPDSEVKSESEAKPESEPKPEPKTEEEPTRRKKRDLGTFLMIFDQLKTLAVIISRVVTSVLYMHLLQSY